MSTYLAALMGYVIGGIPTGIWISKVVAGKDPRAAGSGSSGATNVSRVLGKKWGVVVLLLDALKGFAPVYWLVPLVFAENIVQMQIITACAAVMGHVFTPFAKFKGGKGVATAAGAMAAIDAIALLYSLAVWLVVFLISRRVSLASLLAAAAFPGMLLLSKPRHPTIVFAGGVVIALFLIYTHRANLARLVTGNEPRFF
ncbi:MAG: glycerol-3-phosphate 1-O-acyltransferase PlsY [bacterium]|nr:glycerol-3-phosphate 1-O-acyltransferase PlsY [bacterium]